MSSSESVNYVRLVGRITFQPRLGQSRKNVPVCSFPIAIHEHSEGGEEITTYIDLEAWGALAVPFAKRRVGDVVRIEGRLRLNQWTRGNEQRSRVKVLIDREVSQ